jgi:hypothetical protein
VNPTLSFRRLAAVTAIISAPLALGCLALALLAAKFNFAAFGNPTIALGGGIRAAELAYWSMLLDLLGYYLLLIPLTIYLYLTFRASRPGHVALYSVCGLGYTMVGASGAAVLAAVWPSLAQIAAITTGPDHNAAVIVFQTVSNAVDRGLWNTLELILAGVWWIGIGLEIRRVRPVLGATTIILGAAALLDTAGTILGLEMVTNAGLVVYLLLAPAWAAWVGLTLGTLNPEQGLPSRSTAAQRRLSGD